MKKILSWLSWATVGLFAGLVALNWPLMLQRSQVDFLVGQAQLPLGLLLLAVPATALVLIVVVQLQQQVGALLETRRLFKELQRVHDLADRAEASRIDGLRQQLDDHFQALARRLDRLEAARPGPDAPVDAVPALSRILPGPWKGQ